MKQWALWEWSYNIANPPPSAMLQWLQRHLVRCAVPVHCQDLKSVLYGEYRTGGAFYSPTQNTMYRNN